MKQEIDAERQAMRREWHRQRRAESRKRAAEEAARMAQVHICTMSTELPEGGEFVMTWPETIAPESLDMVEGLFALQWKAVRKWVSEREAALDAVASASAHRSQQDGEVASGNAAQMEKQK